MTVEPAGLRGCGRWWKSSLPGLTNNILSENQYEFRSGRSTVIPLLLHWLHTIGTPYLKNVPRLVVSFWKLWTPFHIRLCLINFNFSEFQPPSSKNYICDWHQSCPKWHSLSVATSLLRCSSEFYLGATIVPHIYKWPVKSSSLSRGQDIVVCWWYPSLQAHQHPRTDDMPHVLVQALHPARFSRQYARISIDGCDYTALQEADLFAGSYRFVSWFQWLRVYVFNLFIPLASSWYATCVSASFAPSEV